MYVPTARLEGTALLPDGRPALGAQIFLMTNSAVGMSPLLEGPLGLRPQIQPNGRFVFTAVRPGDYTVLARASSRTPTPGAPARPGPVVMDLWASSAVRVDGRDVGDVALRLEPGMAVNGRVVFEAKTLEPPSDLTRVNVTLRVPPSTTVVSIGVPSTALAADGTFKIDGAAPGKYLVSAYMPTPPGTPPFGGWMLKSAVLAGKTSSTRRWRFVRIRISPISY
jgi:hypothetical protein